MEEETHACSICGQPQGRHFHILDITERLKHAPAEDRSSDHVSRVDSVRLRISPEEVIWVCDQCAPRYQATHPDFYYEL